MWIEKNKCSGCFACANVCPVKAIEMKEDEAGFKYPIVDNDKCINCNLCVKTCNRRLNNSHERNIHPKTYAVWSRDEGLRFESTSGGAFSELANSFLEMGGVIVGAQYNDNNLVEHVIIQKKSDLYRIRQSKYIQSDINYIYSNIKKELKLRKVLFCGAPCQVAGLYAYLNEDAENLTTIDFICRGVNSPKAYKAWLNELEVKKKKKVKRVWFKYKVGGWKTSPRRTRIDFEDDDYIVLEEDENLFMSGYLLKNLFMRPSCGNCDFKGIPRLADLTMADFWGIEEKYDDDKGTSMVLVNSNKGMQLFNTAMNKLFVSERNFNDIFAGNCYFTQSVQISKDSETFLHELSNTDFSKLIKKFLKINLIDRIKGKIKVCLRKVMQ